MESYIAVALQTGFPAIRKRTQLKENVNRALTLIDSAVGLLTWQFPVKLLGMPELALNQSALAKESWGALKEIAIEFPSEEMDLFAEKAKELDMYLSPGSVWEWDPEFEVIFNTQPLFGPDGKLLYKYRKYNPWAPAETSLSPHNLIGIDDYEKKNPLFPVAKTPIGNIGSFICNDVEFPEVARQLAYNGAEIFLACTAWFDPVGQPPLDIWTGPCRCRSLENMAYGIYVASAMPAPPCPCSGHSIICDYEGRIIAEAGRGEQWTSAIININRLKEYRKTTPVYNFLALNRAEGYTYLRRTIFPPHPELRDRIKKQKEDITPDISLEMTLSEFEKFYSKYYNEDVKFPRNPQLKRFLS